MTVLMGAAKLLMGKGAEPTAKPLPEETEWQDITAELTSVQRSSGNMLTIKFKA